MEARPSTTNQPPLLFSSRRGSMYLPSGARWAARHSLDRFVDNRHSTLMRHGAPNNINHIEAKPAFNTKSSIVSKQNCQLSSANRIR
jgi:hypothetical protein